MTYCHMLQRNLVVLCQMLNIFYQIPNFCRILARWSVTCDKKITITGA